jgi:hypothetical protein
VNFFGLGGFEVLLVGAIALFVLGPKRLLEGILEDDMKLDEVGEEFRKANEVIDKSIPRDWQFSRPPIQVDYEIRNAIPDLDISGGDGSSVTAKKTGPAEVIDGDESSAPRPDASDRDSGEAKS